jgi:myosin heavy subunit
VSHLKIAEGDYRVGMSKVFFRAGVIARLDDELDRELARRIIDMQARVRQFLAQRREEKKAGKGKEALMRSEEDKAKWLQVGGRLATDFGLDTKAE